jgi:hypothetical protein
MKRLRPVARFQVVPAPLGGIRILGIGGFAKLRLGQSPVPALRDQLAVRFGRVNGELDPLVAQNVREPPEPGPLIEELLVCE